MSRERLMDIPESETSIDDLFITFLKESGPGVKHNVYVGVCG